MPTEQEIQVERERRQRRRQEAEASGPTPEAIARERERRRAEREGARVGVVEDAARSFGTGVVRGAGSTIGIGGDIRNGIYDIARSAVRGLGGDERLATAIADQVAANLTGVRAVPGQRVAGSESVTRAINSVIPGEEHVPQTMVGEYARTVGEFAGGAVAPGGVATRLTRVVAPAVASETAGQLTEGTPAEPIARFVGGLGGGVATEMSIAANARRAAARAPRAEREALEREFGPMTQGERSANPRARLEEDDMRRGIGSERAQRTLQAYDDRRAPEIRQNVMRIATRGQEPLSEDIGAAGTTVADTLRGRVDDMRQRQAQLYQEAFDQAEAEIVSANQVNNELLDRVDAIIAEEFLDVPAARAVIGRLQEQIRTGQATYGTVERARQALNRQLTSSMRAGDDAQSYAIHRIIDEVDGFVAPRLSDRARRALTEARGFTREMMGQYSQRQRTDLATGHQGRSDPGGRAIERVLNTDLTGEQVIDAILGAGTKPSAQTLGAVRRIREINDSIVYTNRNAASGVRVPGRRKVGGQTRGERAFAADSEDARFGIELPNPELQGLREALFHRLLRPLDARNEGGMIPAQTIVTNFRRALDGPGAEITAVLFTEREIAAMRRALAYMESLVPPSGAAVSGTTPALSRMVQGTFDKLVGLIPGIGPVIRETIENANTTGAARRAIQPPGRGTRVQRADQPTALGPALTAGAATGSSSQSRERR